MLWVTVISNFTNFQVETSITIEQLLPSSIDSENPEVVKKSVLIYVFITVSYALIGSLVFNIILLPKSCNENPDTPIMKLEYQIQEWWNSKCDYYYSLDLDLLDVVCLSSLIQCACLCCETFL